MPIIIGQFSVICDWLVVSKTSDQKVQSDATKLDSLIYYSARSLCQVGQVFRCSSLKYIVSSVSVTPAAAIKKLRIL